MRRRVFRPTTIVLVAALAIAVLSAPTQAVAARLYACVKGKTGTARFVKARTRCRRGERKIAWNTRGAPGVNGANGTNGASGKNGAGGKDGTNGKDGLNGATAGLVAFKDGRSELPLTRQPVVTLSSPPAGEYIVTATVQLEDGNATEGVSVHCYLAGDEATVELQAKGGPGSLSLLGAVVSPPASSIELECNGFGTSGIEVSFARLAAIQVQSLGVPATVS
jgi:hypothetical protein